MATQASFSFADASKERSSMSFYLPEITALNFSGVTQDLDEVLTFIVEELSIGAVFGVSFTRTFGDDVTAEYPTDQNAQRERKFLVTMRDVKRNLDVANTITNVNYGKIFQFEIPCANVVNLTGSDFIDESSTVFAQAKAVFEANIRSPWNWAAFSSPTDLAFTELISIKKVGRNT